MTFPHNYCRQCDKPCMGMFCSRECADSETQNKNENSFSAIAAGRAVPVSPSALALLRKDAARYRYLRRSHQRSPDEISKRVWLGGDELDQAIDEAIERESISGENEC